MKPYIYAAILFLFALSNYFSLEAGKDIQAGIESQARQDIKKNEVEKIKIIYKEKVKIEVKYRDRIKKIYLTKDVSGCLDTKLSDAGVLPSTANN